MGAERLILQVSRGSFCCVLRLQSYLSCVIAFTPMEPCYRDHHSSHVGLPAYDAFLHSYALILIVVTSSNTIQSNEATKSYNEVLLYAFVNRSANEKNYRQSIRLIPWGPHYQYDSGYVTNLC